MTLRAAFATLLGRGFRGMPVLDDDGRIVANVSTSDVRAIGAMAKDVRPMCACACVCFCVCVVVVVVVCL